MRESYTSGERQAYRQRIRESATFTPARRRQAIATRHFLTRFPMALAIDRAAPTLFMRRASYERSGITREAIDARFGLTADEFRVEGDLVAIGPIPGEDSLADFIEELEQSGLVYFDDFFELSGNWPDWLRLYAQGASR